MVIRRYPEAQFLIAGDGPERAALELLSAQLGVAGHVRFLGRSEAMAELFASLDVVVSASREEGLPITLLEAMASARPIVATTVGEVPTVLDRGKAGVLVPPEDQRALADAILALLDDPGLRKTYAERAAHRVAEHFSANQMTAHYLSMYAEASNLR